MISDIRYALRQLRQAPGFALTALVTLAVGIGVNTAIFTLVHGVLLKSLPVERPDQLYKFGDEYNCCVEGDMQGNWSMFSYPFYLYARDRTPAFEQLAAAQTNRPDLAVRRTGASGGAESLTGEFVSGNYFATLGVQAFAGRVLAATDDEPGAAPAAVISYRTWQTRYGLDPSLIGAPVTINGVALTVVGVASPAFFGDRLESDPPDFWIPLGLEPTFHHENSMLRLPATAWLYIIGRLRPDARPAQVQAQLTTELREYLRTPGNTTSHHDLTKIDKQQLRLAPGGGGINAMKDGYEEGLLLLMAASLVVLVIACANLANLLLARAASTRMRTALQVAIGAARSQIVRSQLTESLVLALLGGAAGLLVANYASRAMLLIAFRGSTFVPISTSPSVPILLFTFAVATATGIVFGVGPAWIASRTDPAEALRGGTRVTKESTLPQQSLIVVQAALSLVLLTMAGLLAESLKNLENQAYGFERQGRLLVQINPGTAGYKPEGLLPLYDRLQERLARTPNVISSSLSIYTAQQGNNWSEEVFFPGKAPGDFNSSWDRVSARYFETIGTPIVRGRSIGDQDTAAAQKVAVINEAFARKYFPNIDPIGQHFGKQQASHAADYEVVGVAKDAKYLDPSRPARPIFFVALPQKVTFETLVDRMVEDASMFMGTIELHVSGEADAAAPEVRRALAEVDPNLTPITMRSFDEQVRMQRSEPALIARLSAAFGLIALLLASIGLYGVTAYRVARRTTEVGLRMALGATRRDIAALVLRGAFSQVAVGLVIGIPLALAARRWLQHQLFAVSGFDPSSLVIAVLALGACALVASLLPAARAAAIEPMRALRAE